MTTKIEALDLRDPALIEWQQRFEEDGEIDWSWSVPLVPVNLADLVLVRRDPRRRSLLPLDRVVWI